jgi:spore coat protein CotH
VNGKGNFMTVRKMVLLLVACCVCGSSGTQIDSSDLIFDDSKIHRFDLKFYYADWADSLACKKSLPDEDYIPAQLTYRTGPAADSIVLDSVGVRYKGNSSYAFAGSSAKKPFKFSFDEYRDGQRFFGIKKLNFGNNAKDPTMMREKISYDILGRFMQAPRAAFAAIYVEGELIGLYTQVEQVDKTFLESRFGDKDGNLYKSNDEGSTLLYEDSDQSSYMDDYELKTNETENDWSRFVLMLDKLNNTDPAAFTAGTGGLVALDNVCRYLAFNMVFSNFDSYTGSGRNYYLYDNSADGRFTLIPWDLNLSFGAYGNNWSVINADVVSIDNLSARPLNRRIIENDSLRQVYLQYIRVFLNGPFCTDTIASMAATWKSLIDSFVQADTNKLHSYEDFLANIDNSVYVIESSSRTSVPGLTSFCTKRSDALRTQLDQYLPVANPRPSQRRSVCALLGCRTVSSGRVVVAYETAQSCGNVCMELYDAAGNRLCTFNLGAKAAGPHEWSFDCRTLAPGCRIVRMTAGKAIVIGRITTTGY